MRRHENGSSSSVPARPNAFSSAFLEQLQDSPEPLTAGEADFSGPWKVEPMGGPPALFAVLREWESVERGDVPEAVFLDQETAWLFAAILPVSGREPLFHQEKASPADAPLEGSHPLRAVYGDQGPRVCGWVRRFNPQAVAALHFAEGLIRMPRSLAEVNLAAGGVALEQVGRYLAERQRD